MATIRFRIKLKTELVLLLFAVLFMSVGTNLTVARNAAVQVGSATPANMLGAMEMLGRVVCLRPPLNLRKRPCLKRQSRSHAPSASRSPIR